MANQKHLFAKPSFAKLKLAGVAAALLISSAELGALGLGALEVQSNLDQPLRGTIELRTSAGDDVDSVRASIASRADFENLGIDYPSYLGDISLNLEQGGGSGIVLRVDSGDVIIKEPFIHFLVRVDWSGGSFLREYTALIDPPVYAAESPQSIAQPKLVGTDQEYESDTLQTYELDPVDESAVVDEGLADSEPIFGEEPLSTDDSSSTAPVEQDSEYYEPEAVSEVLSDDAPTQTSQDEFVSQATDAQYGPVASGESLSVIAQELQRQFPDLSIYQIMQVMFEENQSAFINGNINGLIQGSILNIGDLNAIRAVDVEQSKVFFRNQLAEWDPSVLQPSSSDDSLSIGQDEYSFGSDSFSSDSEFGSSDTGVSDNFQVGSGSNVESFASDGSGDTNAAEVVALRSQITELQTSLASSSIENQELTERISILEGQLADMNRLMNLSVEDADMANVEATLAAQNDGLNSSGLDSEDGSVLGDPVALDTSAETVVDADFVDSLLAEAEQGVDDVDAVSDFAPLEGEQADAPSDSQAAGVELAEPEQQAAPKPVVIPVAAEQSFMEKVQDTLFADGLWRILAGVGAVVVGGLGLFILRRRRADEEFEISMLSIESNSQSVDIDAASASASMSASITQSQMSKAGDKETSFLTVYSDSDAVVQADEVDPIAEADVYIAYGRDEQAEEVLLDGVASNPDRLDIKHKLLGLYHKNKNAEGFERVAEELYSQRAALTPEVWADVSKMGKDLSTNNPLFDLSPDDLAVAGIAEETVAEASPADDLIDDDAAQAVEEAAEAVDAEERVMQAAELDPIAPESYQLEADEIDQIELASEAIGSALDEDSENSIQLINFDDGRSEISELDEVEIDALALDDDEIEQVSLDADSVSGDADSGLELASATADSIEIDISDDLQVDSIEFDNSPTLVEEPSIAADDDERSISEVQEVSGLEIDADYDESRTQYELAKVFVDLGDEDGARKILHDIVENAESSNDVLDDAKALLESIA